MNKNLIVFLVFVVALVFLFTSTSIFNPQGTTALTLRVTSANTTIVVKDDVGNVINNDNGKIVLGETYTITIEPNSTYELKTLKINGVSVKNDIVENIYSFTCNGNITIFAVSVVAGSNGEVVAPDIDDDGNPINYVSVTYYSADPFMFRPSGADIDLMIYDSDYNLLALLERGETYNFLIAGNTYIFEYTITNGGGYATINLYNNSNEVLATGLEGERLSYTTDNQNLFVKIYYKFVA